MSSGVFKGGHGAMAPLWPDHENFLQATLYKKVRFGPKMGEFVVFFEALNIQKQKVFQLQGGFSPLTPRPGALPDPRYRLALHALAMAPPMPNSKYATGHVRF